MSSSATPDPDEPKRATMQAWCDATRAILGGTVKTKRRGLWLQKAALETLASRPRPAELSDDEWQLVQDAATGMNLAAKQPAPQDPIAAPHRQGADAAADAVEALLTTARARLAAHAALDPTRIATLDVGGQAALRRLDAPGAALDDAALVRASIDAAETAARALGEFLPDADRDAVVHGCRSLVAALDLDAARVTLAGFEKTIDRLRAEAVEVAKIKAALPAARGGGAMPASLADWRRLNGLNARRVAVRADIPAATAAAEAMALTTDGHPNPKRQQMAALLPPLDAALKDWVKLPLPRLLSLAVTPGSVAWMEEILDRLRAPAAATATEALEARKAADWTRFEVEVQGFWATFAASGYAPAHRGPFGTRAALTETVRARLAASHGVTLAGRHYTITGSDTSGMSLHTAYPKPPGGYPKNAAGQLILSFIYHL